MKHDNSGQVRVYSIHTDTLYSKPNYSIVPYINDIGLLQITTKICLHITLYNLLWVSSVLPEKCRGNSLKQVTTASLQSMSKTYTTLFSYKYAKLVYIVADCTSSRRGRGESDVCRDGCHLLARM
jgi:hypothetical protein